MIIYSLGALALILLFVLVLTLFEVMHVCVRILGTCRLESVSDRSDVEAVLGYSDAAVKDIVKYESLLCRADA